VEAGTGRPGRRIYGAEDVVKLAALGHFGHSGADVGQLGEEVARLDLSGSPADYLLVTSGSGDIEVVAAGDLRARVSAPGSRAVFDPAPVLRRMAADRLGSKQSGRRSA
jgi:hypothetical protein